MILSEFLVSRGLRDACILFNASNPVSTGLLKSASTISTALDPADSTADDPRPNKLDNLLPEFTPARKNFVKADSVRADAPSNPAVAVSVAPATPDCADSNPACAVSVAPAIPDCADSIPPSTCDCADAIPSSTPDFADAIVLSTSFNTRLIASPPFCAISFLAESNKFDASFPASPVKSCVNPSVAPAIVTGKQEQYRQ